MVVQSVCSCKSRIRGQFHSYVVISQAPDRSRDDDPRGSRDCKASTDVGVGGSGPKLVKLFSDLCAPYDNSKAVFYICMHAMVFSD